MRLPIIVATLCAVLVTNARAQDAARPTPDPVAACQTVLAHATRRLGDGVRVQLGRCIGAGMRCLTTDAADVETCCAAAAPRCRAQELKLVRAAQRFAAAVASGRCARLPLPTVLAADGLGFESAAATCQCLPAPIDVVDLRSLGTCLARLVDAETTRLLATVEAPRAAEALACVGLDRHVETLAASDAVVACDSTRATVTPTPFATSAPKRTRRPRRTPAPTVTAGASGATAAATGATATGVTPTPAPTSTPVCGNGIVEGDEQCDGDAYDDDSCALDVCTCEDFCDDAGGSLRCRRDCTIDFNRCTAGGCEF